MTTRRVALGVAAAGFVTVVVALALLFTSAPRAATAPVPTVSTGTLPAVPPKGTTTAAAPMTPPARDARLRLDRLDLDARVVRVGLRGSTMQVPRDPGLVGWWSEGAVPGAARGSAVLVGHVNYAGRQGAFASLPAMRPGDLLRLTDPAHTFRVAAVRTYPKSDGLPQQIFATAGPPQLVLITCGGSFDASTGNYRDNVVVFAQPV